MHDLHEKKKILSFKVKSYLKALLFFIILKTYFQIRHKECFEKSSNLCNL